MTQFKSALFLGAASSVVMAIFLVLVSMIYQMATTNMTSSMVTLATQIGMMSLVLLVVVSAIHGLLVTALTCACAYLCKLQTAGFIVVSACWSVAHAVLVITALAGSSALTVSLFGPLVLFACCGAASGLAAYQGYSAADWRG